MDQLSCRRAARAGRRQASGLLRGYRPWVMVASLSIATALGATQVKAYQPEIGTIVEKAPCVSAAEMRLAQKATAFDNAVHGMTRAQAQQGALNTGMMSAARSPMLQRGQRVEILRDSFYFFWIRAGKRDCWVPQNAVARDD